MEGSSDGTASGPASAELATAEEGVPPCAEDLPPCEAEHQSAFFRALESMPDASQDYLAGLSLARVGGLIAEFLRRKGGPEATLLHTQIEERQRGPVASDDIHARPTAAGREVESALRIQRAYRGHRDRRAFYKLVAELSAAGAAAGVDETEDSVYVQIVNRSARKFWDAHFGNRGPSHLEVLEAFDTWLAAGEVDGATRLASM